jgi:hypothetical protein
MKKAMFEHFFRSFLKKNSQLLTPNSQLFRTFATVFGEAAV